MKRIILAVAVLLLAMVAVAASQERRISVVGEGSAVAMPDNVVVTMDVIAREEKSADALETLTKKIRKMLEPLKAAGMESKNIVTTGFKVEEVSFREEKETRTEHVATATMKFKLGNVTRVGDLIDKAISGGASVLTNPLFSSSTESTLESQALEKAVQDAKAKATKAAEALGGTVGKALKIDISYTTEPYPMNDGKLDIYQFANTSKSPILATPELSVQAKVHVDFELIGM